MSRTRRTSGTLSFVRRTVGRLAALVSNDWRGFSPAPARWFLTSRPGLPDHRTYRTGTSDPFMVDEGLPADDLPIPFDVQMRGDSLR